MMMTKSATSNAALQLHCATPKKLAGDTRGRGRTSDRQQPQEAQDDVRASRYRLLDERERDREAREIERIQRELQQQRRPRTSANGATSRSSSNVRSARSSRAASPQRVVKYYYEDDAPPPYDTFTGSRTTVSSRRSTFANQRHDPPSPQWTEGDGDEAEPCSDDDGAAVKPAASSDFQVQVLRELQKLKEAQRSDLEAIQRLQREKENAERKAKALEATLREHALHSEQKPKATTRHRPPALSFGDLEDGDESAPPVASPTSPGPPEYEHTVYDLGAEADYAEGELDCTDSELSPASSSEKPRKWATESSRTNSQPKIQRSESPVFAKRDAKRDAKHHARPSSARSSSSQLGSSSHVQRRPRSARGAAEDTSDDEDSGGEDNRSRSSSRGRSMTRSRSGSQTRSLSRARSASREDLRRSCSFYQEKEKAQHEQDERERETQRRLERAARATPPANLLKRQEEAQRKKREQLQEIEKERYAELSPAKRVRARNVPATTYVAEDADEREQARKERLRKRSQELMARAELPTRMQMAKEEEAANAKALEAAAAAASSTRMAASLAMSMAVSVKARRKLQEQLEEEEKRRQLMRPKPVPNFTYLQHQWEKVLSVKKSKHKPTEPQGFFSARERELEALRLKKEMRKRKMAEQEEQARQQEKERQRELLERTKKSAGCGRAEGPKLTKSDELRKKKVQEAIHQQRRQQEQERQEQERRELRLKEASRRVAAQVKHGESKRKGDYAGEFVELTAVESVAKEKAKKQREQFREAVQRNKERLLAAVATKPSLMERFAIDLKREEHKKSALEAVVKQVFQKNFKDMKGILTEEEEELARDLVAADEEEEEEGKAEGRASHRSSGGEDDEDDDADAAGGGDADADED